MVGPRLMGHVNSRLNQAKGTPGGLFGGVSIILVGDQGQLPPVKDTVPYESGSTKPENQYERQGMQLYGEFRKVVFLDQIMRAGGEAPELAYFRDLQLRCRDGELREGDWGWFKDRALDRHPELHE